MIIYQSPLIEGSIIWLLRGGMGDLLWVKFIFPKPVEIEYISLAYNGVTYFSPALHATTDIFFWNHLHSRAWVASHADVLRGIQEECLRLELGRPVRFYVDRFLIAGGQQIKTHSFSKNKETSKIHKNRSITSKSFRKYFILRSMPSSTQRAWSDQNEAGATCRAACVGANT